MVGIIIGGVGAALATLFAMRFAAGTRLFKDPQQHELAFLLVRAVQRPCDGPLVKDREGRLAHANGAPINFISGWQEVKDYLAQQIRTASPRERKLRLTHALTLAQSQVSASDYGTLKTMVATYRG